jgi:hypothetical protein
MKARNDGAWRATTALAQVVGRELRTELTKRLRAGSNKNLQS